MLDAICSGRGTPIYGLYRYVPRNRVYSFRGSRSLNRVYFWTLFLLWSSDREAKLYYLILECENAILNKCLGLKLRVSVFALLVVKKG